MTTRRIYTANQFANSTWALDDEQQKMLDLSVLAQSILGISTLLSGFACTPTAIPSLTVNVAAGAIFSNVAINATQFGIEPNLPANPNLIQKYAYTTAPTPFTFIPPGVAGESRNDLIQFQFSEQDGSTQTIPLWGGITYITVNSTQVPVPNPAITSSVATQRIDSVTIQVKQGTPAPTGSQTTPTPDSGFTGGWIITTTNGVSTINTGNIAVYPGAPFITETLTQKISQATADARYAAIQNVFNTDYIQGFKIVNSAGDTDHDIDFNPGACWDSTGVYPIKLLSTLTKQIDASWAAGNNQGGLFSGSVAPSATYHLFSILNPTTGAVDCGFDTSVTAANRPVAYTAYRRIASLYTDSSSHLCQITNIGDDFILQTQSQDADLSNQGTSAVNVTLSVPTGIIVKANIIALLNLGADTLEVAVIISSLFQPDVAPVFPKPTPPGAFTLINSTAGNTEDNVATLLNIYTNTSAQIRTRQSFTATDTALFITTLGWTDSRGRYG